MSPSPQSLQNTLTIAKLWGVLAGGKVRKWNSLTQRTWGQIYGSSGEKGGLGPVLGSLNEEEEGLERGSLEVSVRVRRPPLGQEKDH